MKQSELQRWCGSSSWAWQLPPGDIRRCDVGSQQRQTLLTQELVMIEHTNTSVWSLTAIISAQLTSIANQRTRITSRPSTMLTSDTAVKLRYCPINWPQSPQLTLHVSSVVLWPIFDFVVEIYYQSAERCVCANITSNCTNVNCRMLLT